MQCRSPKGPFIPGIRMYPLVGHFNVAPFSCAALPVTLLFCGVPWTTLPDPCGILTSSPGMQCRSPKGPFIPGIRAYPLVGHFTFINVVKVLLFFCNDVGGLKTNVLVRPFPVLLL